MASMDVDVPAPSLESLSAASSLEKLDLENFDLTPLNNRMQYYSDGHCWEYRRAMAIQESPTSWPWLIGEILMLLTVELSKTDIKESIIAEPSLANVEILVNSFTEDELEEWKVGARKGIESNDWRNLITHRTYLSNYQIVPHLLPNPSKDPKTKILECSL